MSQDFSEQFHEPKRSTWAIWIIIFILIAYGTFWMFSEQSIRSEPLPSTTIAPTASLDALEASVIKSDIPDYSKDF